MHNTRISDKESIYRAENLLQNRFPQKSLFSALIAVIKFEKLKTLFAQFSSEMVQDTGKMTNRVGNICIMYKYNTEKIISSKMENLTLSFTDLLS